MSEGISWIEKMAVSLGLISDTAPAMDEEGPGELMSSAPPEQWLDWEEIESHGWPAKTTKRNYQLIPTTCFNCESACGLLAFVDKKTQKIRKFEGNPLHPASRGRLCAKGPATINQINDTDRILRPLQRVGKRGEGKWKEITWQEAIEIIATRVRTALLEERRNEVVYHVGRPGSEGYVERVLQAWGVDGHNSHTNICSSGARFGYAIWQAYDRPSPDHANAKLIFLISAHLESGHYFNPHAQRIIEGKLAGAKLVVVDPRLSNTASMANHWLAPHPGTEAALLLAMAHVIIREHLYDATFLQRWVNWEDYLRQRRPDRQLTFESFIEAIDEEYAKYTPEYAQAETGVDAALIVEVAREIGKAGHQFAAHNWRGPSSGHLGGWQVARTLHFLSVLVGAVGTKGGTGPNAWSKFRPQFFDRPPGPSTWNELHFPPEYPLTHYELSHLLPHLLKQDRGKIDVYFTRVFNPVWTYPDGFSWIEMLENEETIGLHVALTPTWNETAYWADLVLPMGHSAERHDLNSYETHAGMWIAFRQPVLRVARENNGETFERTYEANPGRVWEEDEFWIELSWQIDPTGQHGVRKHFESPERPGEKISIDEYYAHIFDRVPGLPEAAAEHEMSPLQYMRRFGAFQIKDATYERHERQLSASEVSGTEKYSSTQVVMKDNKAIGVDLGDASYEGFPTPSRKQEIYSQTMVDWGWPEYCTPGYIPSHVYWRELDREAGEFCLLPTFRLPNLIHSRSGAAKWLNEIAHGNPVWMHYSDAERLGLTHTDLIRVQTEIGYFVDRLWLTEAIRPGVVACSHHLGRWRRQQDADGNRWSSNLVQIERTEPHKWRIRHQSGPQPFRSADPDSSRLWWRQGGVHQNIVFPVQPDPISGMHCWHQKVTVKAAQANDEFGDIFVDTERAHEAFLRWLAKTRPGPGPGGLRRPLWMNRPLRPQLDAFYTDSAGKSETRDAMPSEETWYYVI